MTHNQESKDNSLVFKVILVGDPGRLHFHILTSINFFIKGVGKSSILLRYTENEFKNDYKVTIGLEFCSKLVEIDSETFIKLQMWDTVRIHLISSVLIYNKRLVKRHFVPLLGHFIEMLQQFS